jgi:anti-anti-sigma factor
MRFLISVRTQGTTTRLIMSGEIDLAAQAMLRRTVEDVLHKDAGEVIVDLADVTFLDCSGIGALVYGRRLARERGRPYRIVNARDLALTLLRLTGVLTVDELAS